MNKGNYLSPIVITVNFLSLRMGLAVKMVRLVRKVAVVSFSDVARGFLNRGIPRKVPMSCMGLFSSS